MEENIYVVSVRIGLQMKFQFEGIMLDFDDLHFTFGECNENYTPKFNGDVLVLDFEKMAVALNSNHFSMAMDIQSHKKVGDNYHFKCATDLSRVDVYICEKLLWEEKHEAIFCF